jgi:hypothetical protein
MFSYNCVKNAGTLIMPNIAFFVFQRNERREREQRELAKQALQAQKFEYSDQLSSFDGTRSSSSSETDSYTNGTQVLPVH